jgi:alkanesulfonate monooxygenase SsuD/methylene tetrahydromethanopterin reductase-like flavin-dependent oxidoreductase (luciferase family)
MLDREGAAGPAEVAIVGDEDSVANQIGAIGEAGATDFNAALFGTSDEIRRTLTLVTALAKG